MFNKSIKEFYGLKKDDVVSYKQLIEYLFTDLILCNDLINNLIDNDFESMFDLDYDLGIYQYYIVDINNWHLEKYKEFLEKTGKNSDILLFYSEKLDLYLLGVTHFGIGWGIAPTNIKIEN